MVDADLSGYFDSIPHAPLMKSVARRVSDRNLLALLKQWLVAPVEEGDGQGSRTRTTRAKDEKRGVPQGAPLSPLLSNLYMCRFLLGWQRLGHEKRLEGQIVNYADDFVICCRGTAARSKEAMRGMMDRVGLTVNEDKTRMRRLPDESFDFLGYTIGRCHSQRTGRTYIGTRPSKKSVRRAMAEVSELTVRRTAWRSADDVVDRLNRLLLGWGRHFCLGPVSKSYRALDAHACHRLRWWLCRKHKQGGKGTSRYPDEYLYDQLGLVRLRGSGPGSGCRRGTGADRRATASCVADHAHRAARRLGLLSRRAHELVRGARPGLPVRAGAQRAPGAGLGAAVGGSAGGARPHRPAGAALPRLRVPHVQVVDSRAVGKAEHLAKGANPRFVVTSLPRREASARRLFEKLYCARGDMENRIKEQQFDLFADRTSTHDMRANQLRLYFASFAYVLLHALRRLGARDTELARAQCGSLRLSC